VTTNDIVLLGASAKCAGEHPIRSSLLAERQGLDVCVDIELLVEPANERTGCGLAELASGEASVDRALHANVSAGLDL
jgi:hypothetical protein